MFSLAGRIALVSGAGQSVGEGIAKVLARQGAAVIVNDLFADRAEKVAAAIVEEGNVAVAAAFDVTDFGSTLDHVRAAEKELGGHVDIVVNNAGVAEGRVIKPFRELSPEEWRAPIDLNIFGAMNCIKVVLDGMCDAGWGPGRPDLVGICENGTEHQPVDVCDGQEWYRGLHPPPRRRDRAVRRHREHRGSRAPEESRGQDAPPEMIEQILRTIPIGRLGDPPIEVGAFCAYLPRTKPAASPGRRWTSTAVPRRDDNEQFASADHDVAHRDTGGRPRPCRRILRSGCGFVYEKDLTTSTFRATIVRAGGAAGLELVLPTDGAAGETPDHGNMLVKIVTNTTDARARMADACAHGVPR